MALISSKMDSLKDIIIFNIFEFIDSGDLKCKNDAKESIEKLASKYHITLKKCQKVNLKVIFKKFILNKEGYASILPTLYNSIL